MSEKNRKNHDGNPIPSPFNKKISVVRSIIALIIVAMMLVFAVSCDYYEMVGNSSKPAKVNDEISGQLGILKSYFDAYFYYESDEDAQLDAVLKAYVAASGDRYAEYYTAEELDALFSETAGESEGIGINVIESKLNVGGFKYKVFKVINVTKDSPAAEAGMRVGDYIFSVKTDEGMYILVDTLGYDPALSGLRGAAGTNAEFSVLRANPDGIYEEIPFSVMRRKIETSSVMAHVCETDASVGIVKITNFDLTTPIQLTEAVDGFVKDGIDKVVFDVRYNPGGDLASIVAVLSYFLNEGDTIISASDKEGNTEVIKAAVEKGYSGSYASCNVSRSDLGKYKGLKVAVLCNDSSASAAELFVANFRDHGLGAVVGTTTYGKGSMQSILDLSRYGMGGLRFTTRLYFPPCGESYDGIGIEPDVTVEFDEELYKKNIYEITDAEDNQLQAAIKTFE